MFYRFVADSAQPYTILVVALVVAAIAAWRAKPERRLAVRLTVLLAGLLWAVSTPLVGYLASWSLERSYPPMQGFPEDAEAIVVLSGGLCVYDADGKNVELRTDTALRTIHGAELYHRAGRKPIVATGGKVSPDTPGPTLAEAMGKLLLELGVGPDDLVLETKSRTTYENALYTHEILAKRNVRRIVLVTSATHMPRALRCFRAVGFDVVPGACNYRAGWLHVTPTTFLPSAQAMTDVEAAYHEWLGLAWYWFHGRL